MLPELVLDFSALDRLPTDKDLPYDDGEPMETPWHRSAMNLLIECIECHWHGRKDYFVGGNMFMYFSAERVFHKDFRGPDVFVVRGVDHDRPRLSWVSWQEGGRLPNVIIELSSPSTRQTDRIEKYRLYGERMRVPEYFIYDPTDDSLAGWRLSNGGYDTPLEVEPDTRIWSKELELYLGPWVSFYHGYTNRWLRFFDVHGSVIPTFEEAAAKRAADATARANAEAARASAAAALADKAKTERTTIEAEIARLKTEIAALKQSSPPTP